MDDDTTALLERLAGTWEGHGEGHLSTIDAFRYEERVTLQWFGKPFLEYRQETRNRDDGQGLHRECGYLRHDERAARAELVVAQPSGFTEVHAGPARGGVLDLSLVALGRSPASKPVRSVRRRLVLAGDVLSYDLWLALGDRPEEHHLTARLQRLAPQ